MAATSELSHDQWQVLEHWVAARTGTMLSCPMCAIGGRGNWHAVLCQPLLFDPDAVGQVVHQEEIIRMRCLNCQYLLSFAAAPILKEDVRG